MKTLIVSIGLIILFAISGLHQASGQWTTNGSHIYNSNTGNVGIGNSAPAALLHVGKIMTEPTIRVQNLGGTGGATFQMIDNVSGADWKFKATNAGGFKIRDNAFGLDVIQVEPNSAANSIYVNAAGNVGLGTSAPSASAKLEIAGTDKGFLPPRLTTVQINAITEPATGLMVYNTTANKPQYYDGTVWRNFDGSHFIGESFGGGIIFYLSDNGQHGLISAPGDQSSSAIWGCLDWVVTGTAFDIGTGQANTTIIVNTLCMEGNIAAHFCDGLVLNGYSDWFLPSLNELNEMYLQKNVIGGFANTYYWSSSGDNSYNYAAVQDFNSGEQYFSVRQLPRHVRAIRAF